MLPCARSLLFGLVLTAVATPAAAGTQDDAVILVHVTAHTTAPRCAEVEATPCRDYVVDWPLNTPADLYLVVANGDSGPGIAGVSCGIAYNWGSCGGATMSDGQGVDVYRWTLCTSGLEFPNGCTLEPADEWPASGGGNRITWDQTKDCQNMVVGVNGVQAVAGVFYVYAYHEDYFAVTENVNLVSGPEYQVLDCDGTLTNLFLGIPTYSQVWFSDRNRSGHNPCWSVPVRPTTWGRMKQRY